MKFPEATKDCCYVLGNGPSLSTDIEGKIEFLKQQDIWVVNFFATTDLFHVLKPHYYVIADPVLWQYDLPENAKHRERIISLFDAIKSATWKITFFTPLKTKRHLLPYLKNCSNIEFVEYGKTNIEIVSKWLRYIAYNKNLAMPKPQTVMNAAIFIPINMGYKEVNVIGMNNDWFKNFILNENNVLCILDTHFYENDNNLQVTLLPSLKIHEELLNCSYVFKSHLLINEYALSKGVEINNLTSTTMVDAYNRKKFTI
jgi:hypothetical protein